MKKKSIILYFSLLLNIILLVFTIKYYHAQKINLLKTNRLSITKTSPLADQFGRGKPIDRYYIEKFLKIYQCYIKGDILEMENNDYTYQFGHDITSANFMDLTNKKATLVHDLQDTKGLPANKFDCFICTQTLPYIYDIKAGFASAKKMLKKGGVFLVAAPGLSKLSDKPPEFYEQWHFTVNSFRNLAKEAGFSKIEVNMYGNCFAATAFLEGVAVEDIKNPALLDVQDGGFPVTVTLMAIK